MKIKIIFGLICALLLLCTMSSPAMADPDLEVTKINPDYVFADLTNGMSAVIMNSDLIDSAGSFDVSILIVNDSSIVRYSNTTSVSGGLANNSSTTVSLGYWKPLLVENITITVIADCNGAVTESDEGNNVSVEHRTTTGDCHADTMMSETCYWYRGQNPLQGVYSDAGNHGLMYTTGDYKYKNETVNFELGPSGDINRINGATADIPSGANVKWARLYEYFTWRNTGSSPNPGGNPIPDYELSFDGNPLTHDAYYTDMKGFAGSKSQYGTIAYDVTADVVAKGNGIYQAVRSNYVYGKGYTSGMALVVAYEHTSCPYIEYHINEGYDKLATIYSTQYNVTPEDATTTASFPCINNPISEIKDATLFTMTVDTNNASEALDFNGGGPWSPVWNGVSSYPIATDSRNVTSEVQLNAFCDPEVAEFQENVNNGFGALGAILIVEKDPASNNVYFVPQQSGAPHPGTTIVGVYADCNDSFDTGQINITYASGCMNITDVDIDSTWDAIAGWAQPSDDSDWITFKSSTLESGLLHICDLTIDCECADYCLTTLHFVSQAEAYAAGHILYCQLFDDIGDPIPDLEWHDGCFNCTNLPDLVITDVHGMATSGNNYIVHYTVKNEGNANAPAGHYTNLNVDIGTIMLDDQVPIPLGPGETYDGTFGLEITMTGINDQLMVCADKYYDVMESDESNNCRPNYYPAGIQIAVDVLNESECVDFQEQFLVNITIDPRNIPVYGVEYLLTFDNEVLHAEWQNEGTFLNSDDADTNVYINTIDNGAGTIRFAATRVGVSTGITNPPGTLAVIKFTAQLQGGFSYLNLSNVIASDNMGIQILPVDIINDDVCVDSNLAPVANGTSLHNISNDGEKYLCKVYFDGSASYDPDGSIVSYRWGFDDGNYGTGMLKDHVYLSWNWNTEEFPDEPSKGHYDPFHVSLTVIDDGDPHQLDNTMYFDVMVYTAGDANGDGIVNVLDATRVGLEWDSTCQSCGDECWGTNENGDRADLNNDCVVNVLDAVIIGTCWDHTAWV